MPIRITATILLSLLLHTLSDSRDRQITYTVYIVQEAWHTGIILPVDDVPEYILPEISKFNDSRFLDVSWGEEKYYQFPHPGFFIAASAVLWPTSAVIRLSPFSGSPVKVFPHSKIMEIPMGKDHFYRLCRFISGSFCRDDNGEIIPSTVYRKSRTFFLAKRKYSVFRTCNTWVALAMKESGFDTGTFLLITAGQLFRRLKKIEGANFIQKK